MRAFYTAGFAQAFEEVAGAVVAAGIDPRARLPHLVARVVAQAKLLNPDDWELEIDALRRELRKRLARASVKRGLRLSSATRSLDREVYLRGLELLELSRNAEYD